MTWGLKSSTCVTTQACKECGELVPTGTVDCGIVLGGDHDQALKVFILEFWVTGMTTRLPSQLTSTARSVIYI